MKEQSDLSFAEPAQKRDSHEVTRAEHDALIEALTEVSEGVVICDGLGNIVFESSAVFSWLLELDGTALATQALGEVLSLARMGNSNIRSIELLGPPRYSLTLNGVPVLDSDGQPIGALAVLQNSTERRHHEALLRDFVANVSHELKTPVGAIGLLAEALDVERDQAVISRLIERMQIETERLGQVIDDLIGLSRIESRSSSSAELVQTRTLVAQAMSRVRYPSEHRNIAISVDYDGDPTVYGSHAELLSALHHLLENSVKYSADDSKIEIVCRADGDWTEIAITDHGLGIAPQFLDRIFERFYRVDDARKRSTGGTGLGLAIVRQVVQQHCGEVHVDSVEGEGSTFTLRLPSTASISRNRLVIEGGTDG